MQLVIGNKNYSSWSLRPWLVMTHFDIAFDEHLISLFSADMQEKMQGYCPNNKVPALIDEQLTVWDSLAICEYINEQYLHHDAWPANPQLRATARSVCAEMHSGFFSVREEMPMNCRRQPNTIELSNNAKQEIERIKAIWQSCLAQHQGQFLFDKFSIADAFFMPIVVRFSIYQINVSKEIQSYMNTMLSLPAYQQWLADAMLEQQIITESER